MIAQTTALPRLCFEALDSYFDDKGTLRIDGSGDGFDAQSCGIFVTYRHKQGQLRGCIGSVAPVDLWENISIYAINAAIHDHRFDPLTSPIPNDLSCSVSLLHNHHIVDSFDELIIGKHGVLVKYYSSGSIVSSATFLPEVIKDQRWDIDEVRHHLHVKSSVGAYDSMILTLYESDKTPSLLYGDYLKERKL